jgi:hypothetical protein
MRRAEAVVMNALGHALDSGRDRARARPNPRKKKRA